MPPDETLVADPRGRIRPSEHVARKLDRRLNRLPPATRRGLKAMTFAPYLDHATGRWHWVLVDENQGDRQFARSPAEGYADEPEVLEAIRIVQQMARSAVINFDA